MKFKRNSGKIKEIIKKIIIDETQTRKHSKQIANELSHRGKQFNTSELPLPAFIYKQIKCVWFPFIIIIKQTKAIILLLGIYNIVFLY